MQFLHHHEYLLWGLEHALEVHDPRVPQTLSGNEGRGVRAEDQHGKRWEALGEVFARELTGRAWAGGKYSRKLGKTASCVALVSI